MIDFKCTLTYYKCTAIGFLYITENYLCHISAKTKEKVKIWFSDIVHLNSNDHYSINFEVKSEKYQISWKHSKDIDQIILIFYLWYHTPTYVVDEKIERAIAVYEEERKRKEMENVKRQNKDEKTQQRKRLMAQIGLLESQRGNLTWSKGSNTQLTESAIGYLVIPKTSKCPSPRTTKIAKKYKIESEALYHVHHFYFPVVLELDEDSFSLKINNNFPLQDIIWNTKKLPKKDSVIDRMFSYDSISTITVLSEYEHILIEFRGSEITIQLCSSYIQLLLNQFYLKNQIFDVKWGLGITPFSFAHPVITKLFFLLKHPSAESSDSQSLSDPTSNNIIVHTI